MTADDIVARLGLAPHPEGGWYRETWRAEGPGRSPGTAIYYLLAEGQLSARHRIDADEMWHFYAGAGLALRIAEAEIQLGPDLAAGQVPQALVPAGTWQSARPLGAWCLVGCTVVPGFEFAGFELSST